MRNIREDILNKVKAVVKANYENADCGLFFTRNTVGDPMTFLCGIEDVCIEICYGWAYFEVFNLNEDEQEELMKFYNNLSNEVVAIQ